MPWKVGRGAIPLASGLILLCLLALSWVTFDRVGVVLKTRDWVAHTYQVNAALEKLYGDVVTAESDVRAYMLFEDGPSYDRYLRSIPKTRRGIGEIRRLTQDNPRQKPLLDRLQEAVDVRYGYMRRTVEARKTRSLTEALAFLEDSPARGKALEAMNAVRAANAASLAEERRLLRLRLDKDAAETLQAEAAFVLTLVISVILISTLATLSSQMVRMREAAADDERELREDLEREIERTKAAEARLERTMRELERSNEELQNFAFVASHDLQEPLRKIRAFSDRVRRRAGAALDDESKDSLTRVEAAADRMQRLILDLLELSRVTTKGRPLVRVDLDRTIDEVSDDLQARLEETQGRVVHDPLPPVVADPAQLRQLFQNLIANALKFRREGSIPEVRIEAAERPDGRITIRIADNGIGFEPKYADRIFVVFQRLHGRGEYEGSGIGLAIVRKIVERHGGTIQAEGVPGEGAAFVFDLPGENSEPLPSGIVDAGE